MTRTKVKTYEKKKKKILLLIARSYIPLLIAPSDIQLQLQLQLLATIAFRLVKKFHIKNCESKLKEKFHIQSCEEKMKKKKKNSVFVDHD